MAQCRARVTQSYTAVPTSTAITLQEGEVVDVIKKDELWWFVRKDGRKGYFPASCLVEIVPGQDDLPPGWQKFVSSSGGASSGYRAPRLGARASAEPG